ncbi:MAG: hypothetical protein IPH16_20735 [Haliscomenobacter sp.]|nr:hypothetical protein [Haliscomenobacter sp.]
MSKPALRVSSVLAAGLAFLAFACRQEVSQEQTPQIFVEVFVRFLSPENEYKAQIMFFEGDSVGNARPKKMASGVRFQGQPMREKALGSYAFRYERIQPGPYAGKHVFDFQDDAGKKRSVVLSMRGIKQFLMESPLKRKAGGVLVIERQSLQPGETLLLLFTDEQGYTFSVELEEGFSGDRAILTSSQLSGLHPGTYELYLVKKQERKTTGGYRTVFSSMEYYSPVQEVVVEP